MAVEKQSSNIKRNFRRRFYDVDSTLGKDDTKDRLLRLIYESFICIDELSARLSSAEKKLKKIVEIKAVENGCTPKKETSGVQGVPSIYKKVSMSHL